MTKLKDILKDMGYIGHPVANQPAQPVDSSKPPKPKSKVQQYLWEAGYRGIQP